MIITVLLCLIIVISGARPPPLMWQEQFDMFDLETWSHTVSGWGGGNDEFQFYRNNRKNSYVKDGLLHLRPTFVADEFGEEFLSKGPIKESNCTREPCTVYGSEREIVHPIFSAQISTKDSFSFKYGRIEVRAKMPRGDWIWPAIWMLPKSDKDYGGWPANGEIDIVEIRANRFYKDEKNVSQGVNRVGSTLHFGPNVWSDKYHLAHWTIPTVDMSEDFHTYQLHWYNDSMTFLIDEDVIGSITPPEGGFWEIGKFNEHPGGQSVWANGERMAPFDKEFYIVLNVAVGGRFFPDHWRSNGKPRPYNFNHGDAKKQFWKAKDQWYSTWDRQEMLVDHILVYGWD